MSNIFFSADLHLGHSNIIRHCNRPFHCHEQMDEKILRNFNSVIRPGDSLYLLGDIAWSDFDVDQRFDRLNTKEVHLVWGNHDQAKKYEKQIKFKFRSYKDIHNKAFGPGGTDYVSMCHYPMQTWHRRGYGSYHLFGHVHGQLPGIGRSMDVGVDCTQFYPISLEEVKQRLDKIPFGVKD